MLCVVTCLASTTASAQAASTERIELSGGLRWNGPVTIADAAATENAPSGSTRPLFSTTTTLARSWLASAIIGVRLSRVLRAEFSAAYGTATMSSRITADAEQIADTTVRSPLTQITAEAGIQVQLPSWKRHTWKPFTSAGVGYLRHMYAGRTLIESGHDFYAGGGLYYERTPTRPKRLKASGLRLDLRGYLLRGGVLRGTDHRFAPAVLATAFARF